MFANGKEREEEQSDEIGTDEHRPLYLCIGEDRDCDGGALSDLTLNLEGIDILELADMDVVISGEERDLVGLVSMIRHYLRNGIESAMRTPNAGSDGSHQPASSSASAGLFLWYGCPANHKKKGDFMEALGPVVILAIAIFLIILTIAWIILPFALIGIKPILRDLLEEMRRANHLRDQGQQEPRF